VNGSWEALVEDVGRRYAGRAHRGFTLGKLRHDPVYRALAEDPSLLAAPAVTDLGCGRGILLAALAESARRRGGAGPRLQGLEGRPSHARVAAEALGTDAHVWTADLRSATLPRSDVFCLIDVLHYLPEDAQESLLRRVAQALPEAGVVLVREIDGAAGARGLLARAAERVASTLRGEPGRRFAFRPAEAWRRLLQDAGFAVTARPMDEGTPFANVLFWGRRSR
jgi:trans-aconitate methyltransferase